jgi:hypothetical protein
MAIHTVKVTVKTSGQDGFDIAKARIIATLTTRVVYAGYVMPKRTEVETDSAGVAVLNLWPNELGATVSQYQIKIQDITTGKAFTVYASIPNRDCNLWEVADFGTGLVQPGDVIGVPGPAATIQLGEVGFTDDFTQARIENVGNFNHAIIDMIVPRGLNGSGTMFVKRTETLPFGQPANVVNEGTEARAEYVFYIPQGAPGVPPGATENTYLSFVNGQYVWRTVAAGTGGTGGTTIVSMNDAIFGLYDWEAGSVIPPPVTTPTQNIMDATLYQVYRSAIDAAAVGGKRVAGADSVISQMGQAQKLTLKRDGTAILVADYSGFMTRSTVNNNVVISLNTLGAVSPIVAADNTAGNWTMEITGGTSYARKITLPVAPDAPTSPAAGFNPGAVSLVIPASLDGL